MNKPIDNIAKWAHVRQELASYSGVKREQGDRIFILCPLHGEKTPSGLFNLSGRYAPGFFKCMGCGQTRKWDEIAPLLGLRPFTRGKPKEESAPLIRLPTKEILVANEDDLFVSQKMRNVRKLPRDKKWRSIPTNLLRTIDARLAEFYMPPREEGDEGYWTGTMLYLPCKINGELVGFIKARIKKEPDKPSYVNASGSWSKTHGLFPFDYAIKMMRKYDGTTMVLVEGQRDALRLLSYGIPAMSILGTQSWSAVKARHLETAGVEHLVTFMDGDCAGIKATRLIREVSSSMFSKITSLALWKMKGSPWLDFQHEEDPSKAAKEAGVGLWDPGNCPEWIIKKIKRKYFST